MSNLKKLNAWLATVAVIAAVTAPYAILKAWEREWYRQKIPQEVSTGEVVLIHGESHFREGCGVAIFQLADETKSKIATRGIAALDTVSNEANKAWTPTPYEITGDGLTLEDQWMNGAACARMDDELSKALSDALNKPGSFVKKLYESAVIVIPSAGIVAFVHYG